MKTQQKWVWQLVATLALATLIAGCASEENRGGTGPAYQQSTGTGYYQEGPYWNESTSPGPPYEWQHPSPRDQMTP